MLFRSFYKACLFLLFAGVTACVRRPLPLEPIAMRSTTLPISAVATAPVIPRQLPLLPTTMAFTEKHSAKEVTILYERAYEELARMLDGRYPLSFKRAVYLTENAYLEDQLDYRRFNASISRLARICKTVERTNITRLLYSFKDKENVLRNATLVKLLKDSIHFTNGQILIPYSYDFEDFNGDQDWSNMFVSKLLITHSGNCHSLPFLYKILADETGAATWLALAPNHIYLKQHNEKDGWYNTELTSYTFPNDAWLMASGYISKETIVSGIYMDTLSAKQNITLCLLDLAKGYERKVGPAASEAFKLKSTTLALSYFPQYINAQLLRAETLRYQFERQRNTIAAQQAYNEMESAYTRIIETGYREIPVQMYSDWLQLVKQEKEKFQTKH